MKLPQFRYFGNCGNCGKMLYLARNITFRAVNGPVEPPEHAGSSDGEREDAPGAPHHHKANWWAATTIPTNFLSFTTISIILIVVNCGKIMLFRLCLLQGAQ